MNSGKLPQENSARLQTRGTCGFRKKNNNSVLYDDSHDCTAGCMRVKNTMQGKCCNVFINRVLLP